MRKNKTWEITLTDNARLVANEPIENAVVYTTDTEAYLNFRVIDSGFEFDSATIAMLNKDDGSIVERAMTKEDDTAVYEIESDIIPHFGLWQAQVLFKQGEEVFTSTPVKFVIERYMGSEQPPRLEDVVSWKGLYENATETINELTRINDDLNTTKQNVEQAEAQRVSAESSRVSAETQRLSNETVRVSAEEQREIDHANRSAELDGKADKVVIRNLIKNGDFSEGTEGWLNGAYQTEFEVIDGVAKTIDFSVSNRSFIQTLPEQPNIGDMMYVSINTRVDHPDKLRDMVILSHLSGVKENIIAGPITNITSEFMRFSGTIRHDGEFRLRVLYNFSEVGVYPSYLDDVVVINLTQTFGAGNEPTKEQMDNLIKAIGYIDGEYALNNKEMLGYLMKGIREKANKKQEDWITPTLLNGATGDIQYRKNDLGRVEFKGNVKQVNAGVAPFISLPRGYGMPSHGRLPVLSYDNTLGSVTALEGGNYRILYLSSSLADKEVSLNIITFEGV